jgi:hypothetical protein
MSWAIDLLLFTQEIICVFTASRRANCQLRSSSGALAPVRSVAQGVSIRIGFTSCARTDDGSTELFQ